MSPLAGLPIHAGEVAVAIGLDLAPDALGVRQTPQVVRSVRVLVGEECAGVGALTLGVRLGHLGVGQRCQLDISDAHDLRPPGANRVHRRRLPLRLSQHQLLPRQVCGAPIKLHDLQVVPDFGMCRLRGQHRRRRVAAQARQHLQLSALISRRRHHAQRDRVPTARVEIQRHVRGRRLGTRQQHPAAQLASRVGHRAPAVKGRHRADGVCRFHRAQVGDVDRVVDQPAVGDAVSHMYLTLIQRPRRRSLPCDRIRRHGGCRTLGPTVPAAQMRRGQVLDSRTLHPCGVPPKSRPIRHSGRRRSPVTRDTRSRTAIRSPQSPPAMSTSLPTVRQLRIVTVVPSTRSK